MLDGLSLLVDPLCFIRCPSKYPKAITDQQASNECHSTSQITSPITYNLIS